MELLVYIHTQKKKKEEEEEIKIIASRKAIITSCFYDMFSIMKPWTVFVSFLVFVFDAMVFFLCGKLLWYVLLYLWLELDCFLR